jgi:carbonic anhydrase
MTPEQALKRLKEGNARFVAGTPQQTKVTPELREDLFKNGQHPYAAIVACSDSRTPVELIFDAGPGELFVVRTAGNIVGPSQMGSLEFAVTQLKVSLVVVLGHDKCGAVVAATTDGAFSPSLQAIVDEIRDCAAGVVGDDPEAVVEKNVRHAVSKIAANPDISKIVSEGAVQLAGSKYSLESGLVTFF